MFRFDSSSERNRKIWPFYISICISTLPMQHTMFISLMAAWLHRQTGPKHRKQNYYVHNPDGYLCGRIKIVLEIYFLRRPNFSVWYMLYPQFVFLIWKSYLNQEQLKPSLKHPSSLEPSTIILYQSRRETNCKYFWIPHQVLGKISPPSKPLHYRLPFGQENTVGLCCPEDNPQWQTKDS